MTYESRYSVRKECLFFKIKFCLMFCKLQSSARYSPSTLTPVSLAPREREIFGAAHSSPATDRWDPTHHANLAAAAPILPVSRPSLVRMDSAHTRGNPAKMDGLKTCLGKGAAAAIVAWTVSFVHVMFLFLLAPSLSFIWKTLVFIERCVGEWREEAWISIQYTRVARVACVDEQHAGRGAAWLSYLCTPAPSDAPAPGERGARGGVRSEQPRRVVRTCASARGSLS